MTTITADADATMLPTPAPSDLPVSDRNRILIYLGVLVFIIGFGAPAGGLIGGPITFFLKNRLHMGATEVSLYGLVASIPLYLAFVPGFVRDLWNPFGLGDRGYMIIFGGLCAAAYVVFALSPVTYGSLLAATILLTTIYLFAQGGQTGLGATIARQHVMSGQTSTALNIFQSLATMIPLVAGGYFSDMLEKQPLGQAARVLFLTGAAIMTVFALQAIWRPKVVYDNVHPEHATAFHPWRDVVRLFKHWPVYPALGIWMLWNFAPGSVTPLTFHLQNTLHATDDQVTWWNAIFSGCFIPTYLLYGALCRKVALRKLLFWGTVVAVPQMVPLLFCSSVSIALIAAAPVGLMGGVATAAYLDLLIRSCPKGLEGTIIMASNALYFIIYRLGDQLGTFLYKQSHDFTVCVIAITVVYAMILPTLWLVPRRLTSTPDGETPPGGGFDAG
jgi:Na+/melibiose symporter-like transporter